MFVLLYRKDARVTLATGQEPEVPTLAAGNDIIVNNDVGAADGEHAGQRTQGHAAEDIQEIKRTRPRGKKRRQNDA
jgi:hypothetical protein